MILGKNGALTWNAWTVVANYCLHPLLRGNLCPAVERMINEDNGDD